MTVINELYLNFYTVASVPSGQKDKDTSLAIAYTDEIIAKMSKNEDVLQCCYYFREKLLKGSKMEKIMAFNGLKVVLGKNCQAKMAQIEKCLNKEG